MTKAKFYIYYNLHRKCYSVRHKGKVIGHYDSIIAENVEFKVSQKGRERVLRERKKNVHAFVVSDTIHVDVKTWPDYNVGYLSSVRYNPYHYETFVNWLDKPIYKADLVWLLKEDNKAKIWNLHCNVTYKEL